VIDTVHEAGDHYIVVGRVKELAMGDAEKVDPILFYQGRYRTTRS
jgi:3-hydroxy-9,10-secoandrosta-1,3,5(10)-triene-9,17-dione monooxygenase reductase component